MDRHRRQDRIGLEIPFFGFCSRKPAISRRVILMLMPTFFRSSCRDSAPRS